MPRYEFRRGTSSKFWEIEFGKNGCVTRYGRIGAAGSSLTKKYKSADAAKKAYDALVHEKVRKGYRLVASGQVVATPSKRTRAKKPTGGDAALVRAALAALEDFL